MADDGREAFGDDPAQIAARFTDGDWTNFGMSGRRPMLLLWRRGLCANRFKRQLGCLQPLAGATLQPSRTGAR